MELSILIPARSEVYLQKTVEHLLPCLETDTEVIVILDGWGAVLPELPRDSRVQVVHNERSRGQRAAVRQAAELARAPVLMKVDAHCLFDRGFDRKMLQKMQPHWVMLPTMRMLHAFNWVCRNGHRRFQSDSGPCRKCGEPTHKEQVWQPMSQGVNAYYFNPRFALRYWSFWAHRQQGEVTTTMTLPGSCFMVHREDFLHWDLCSEQFNSWGLLGIEIACKAWLSGGAVMVHRGSWYAHLFRTGHVDFGFPYYLSRKSVSENRIRLKELFLQDRWPQAVRPFSWLLEQFRPPGWGRRMV